MLVLAASTAGANSVREETCVVYFACKKISVIRSRSFAMLLVRRVEGVIWVVGDPTKQRVRSAQEYPGRVDRWVFIGTAGGRVPSDGTVSVEIPTAAVTEASVASIKTLPNIAGLRVADGFTFTTNGMTRREPARAFSVETTLQVIRAEELANSPHGLIYRPASTAHRRRRIYS